MSAIGGKADIQCLLLESEAFLRDQWLLSGVERTLSNTRKSLLIAKTGQHGEA